MKGNQDIQCCGSLREINSFAKVIFYGSIPSMMECPFLAGFYPKDLITEFWYISEIGIFLIFITLISLFLTVIYSLRLFYYLRFTKRTRFMSDKSATEIAPLHHTLSSIFQDIHHTWSLHLGATSSSGDSGLSIYPDIS